MSDKKRTSSRARSSSTPRQKANQKAKGAGASAARTAGRPAAAKTAKEPAARTAAKTAKEPAAAKTAKELAAEQAATGAPAKAAAPVVSSKDTGSYVVSRSAGGKEKLSDSERRYSRIVLREMVRTDFKMRYQGSFLGIIWTVLKPLLLFVVMYFVFVRFLKFTDGTPHFAMVLLLGIVSWNFFSEATGMGMSSIVNHGDMIRKVHFPNYIIVMAATLNSLISLLINIGVVIIFSIINRVHFTWRVVMLPIGIVELYLITLGVALILSTMYVYFHDIQHIWEIFAQALFYGMPIIYPLSMAQNVSPAFAKVILLNPLTQAIQDMRYWLIAPDTTPTVWNYINTPWIRMIPVVLAALILAIGVYVFQRNSRKFAEIL